MLGKLFKPSGNGRRAPGLATQRAFGSVDAADDSPLASTDGGLPLKAAGEDKRVRGVGKQPVMGKGRAKKGAEAADAATKEKVGLFGLFGR